MTSRFAAQDSLRLEKGYRAFGFELDGERVDAPAGTFVFARPGVGAVTLALLFGLFSLIAGIWMLVQGIELRRTGETLDPAAREKTPA